MLLPSGTATGTVGLVTYDINGTDYKVAVMWSTPFDFNLYDVYFNVKVSAWSRVEKKVWLSMPNIPIEHFT